MFRLIMLAICLLPLYGCSTAPSTGLNLPANLAAPCEPLPHIDDGQQKTIAAWIVNTAGMYHDCSARHDATVAAIKGKH